MAHNVIPGPPGYRVVGNLWDIDAENTMESLCRLTKKYGPIWKFHLGSEERIVIGSQALMNEVCNEARFAKVVAAVLKQARNGVRDGLGTAYGPEERNWGIAHRILAPHFGPLAIRSVFSDMQDIATQLVLKWARYGPEYDIEVSDDFTRLTLDAIALCTMDYRFNSYYREAMDPFIDALAGFLGTNGDRAKRSSVMQPLYFLENHRYWGNIERLRETGHAVIEARKQHPSEKKDLLNAMLHEVDPDTGERMTDDSVVNNMITFLFAGHETTSGLLSFTFYYLLSNPETYTRAQQEVDDVVGREDITATHLTKLPYLSAVLRESLRLSPTVPAIALTAKEDTTLGGEYNVKADTPIIALFASIHRDPQVYGSGVDEFRPDRMLDAEFEQRNRQYPNCWKPFGNGMRGCIGRSFAWQQALLVTAMLLQRFDFSMSDPSYHLKIKQTLTIKPDGFRMRALQRSDVALPALEQALSTTAIAGSSPTRSTVELVTKRVSKITLEIYYGSSNGTCEQLASQLASHAVDHGFAVGVRGTLNAAVGCLSEKNPAVLIAASYNGKPASNAARFVDWIRALRDDELAKVTFAVFGCGHHDWPRTFLKVPKYLDSVLEKRGGTRLAALGSTDTAQDKILSDFAVWEEHVFWPAMQEKYGVAHTARVHRSVEPALQVEVCIAGANALRCDFNKARVVASETISTTKLSVKKHLEITLPQGTTYQTGDRLAVLPQNSKAVVRRALRRFGLSGDSVVVITCADATALPLATPIRAAKVFRAYAELGQPASKSDILVLLDAARDETSKVQLRRLADGVHHEEVVVKHSSVLDLLELFPTIEISLSTFLSMQSPVVAREYCISSSPLGNPCRATVTYCATSQPVMHGHHEGFGLATSYLASLAAGDELSVSVVGCANTFRLPEEVGNIPLIMIAAGVGIAPFRGFIQERAAQRATDRALAPALLFYGCRSPEDELYADSFERWQQLGAVSVRLAYSCIPEQSRGCRYVQDRIKHDKADVIKLLKTGARIAVCMPECAVADVKETLMDMLKEIRVVDSPQMVVEEDSKSRQIGTAEHELGGTWHTWSSDVPA